jgi:cytochrome b
VRCLHWALVLSVIAAWASTEWFVGWHQGAGYVALGVVVLRLLWGVVGSRHARFTQFVRSPRDTLSYARLLWRHREPRYVGHNPLGGWMVLALLACVAGLCVTGWLYTTDRFWGDEVVDRLHQALAWALLGLALLHVAGVVFTSFRHRENLVRAMLDGLKDRPGRADVD